MKPASESATLTVAAAAAAGVLILYTLALAIFAREGFPTSLSTGSGFPYLSDQPVGEDGYYMMMAAWNLVPAKA